MDRRRVTLFLALMLVPIGGLEARLAYLQILRPDDFAGGTRRRSIEAVAPSRARIVDGKNRVLARDEPSFDLWLVLEDFERRPAARSELDLPELGERIEKIYRRIETMMNARPERERWRIYARERRTPYLAIKGLPHDKAVMIETNLDRFPGCLVRETLRRVYPYGPAGALVIGTQGRVSKKEADAFLKDPAIGEAVDGDAIDLLSRRGAFEEDMTGRTGIERSFQDRLRGKPGLLLQERDPATGEKSWIELVSPRPGEDVELTIDIEFQKSVEEALAGCGTRATAVVMESSTGAILALATNAPFDPNHFIPPTDAAALRAYFAADGPQPLLNRATQGQLQFGSIFKIVTAIAGLEEGKITPGRVIECRGYHTSSSTHFRCWTVSRGLPPHGPRTVASALEVSCNCYFYQVGQELGIEGISKWASRLGFGGKTGIEVGEATGVLPRPESHPRWSASDSYSLAIGQHELAVTPLQAVRLIAVVANGGTLVRPHLVRAEEAGEPLRISATTLAAVREGLRAVVHGEHGSARDSGLAKFDDVSGKTSSAQAGAGRESHAWFGGYNSKVAVVVLVEHGGAGGAAAAPVAAKIFEKLP